MRANAAWDLHHCYGDRGGEEEPCDPLARQLDANAVMVHPCAVLGGGTLVDRNPPGHQAVWESEDFTMTTSADLGMNNKDPLGAIMPSASVVLRSCSSLGKASESKDTTAGVVAHLSKTITTINILHRCLGHIGEARLRREMQIMGGRPTSGQMHSVYPGEANAASDQEWTVGKCSATCSEDTFRPGWSIPTLLHRLQVFFYSNR